MNISSFLGFCPSLSSVPAPSLWYLNYWPVLTAGCRAKLTFVNRMLSTLTVTALDKYFLSDEYLPVFCEGLGLLWLTRAPSTAPKTDLQFGETITLSLYASSPQEEVPIMSKLNTAGRSKRCLN